jgi:hypothetical protein
MPAGLPECTGDPDRCVMCAIINQIFEGSPKERNPGCVESEQENDGQNRS